MVWKEKTNVPQSVAKTKAKDRTAVFRIRQLQCDDHARFFGSL
jgi:hypothetical protein